MTTKEADQLRKRIAELERDMMLFRSTMAQVLSELYELYETVHQLESKAHNQPAIRDFILDHFNANELRTLCFDLDIDYDAIEGQALDDKARELVLHFSRHDRLGELVAYCKAARPHAIL